jgi:hypothetical protein
MSEFSSLTSFAASTAPTPEDDERARVREDPVGISD